MRNLCRDVNSVIGRFSDIAKKQFKCEEIQFIIQFISRSCQLLKSERQKIVRKHKSSAHKRTLSETYKCIYANWKPAKKKTTVIAVSCITKPCTYRSKKEVLNKTKSVKCQIKLNRWKSMDPFKKKILNESKLNHSEL